MNRFLNTLLLLLSVTVLYGQTIHVNLPSQRYTEYAFCLMQGNRQDTVASGMIDVGGKATFTIPNHYASYRGVGTLFIPEFGRRYNIVINDDPVISLNEISGSEKVDFTESQENKYINEANARQGKILEKYSYVNAGLEIFEPDELLYAQLVQAKSVIEDEYTDFCEEIAGNRLHSARLIEILNYLTGAGSSLKLTEKELLQEQRQFVTEKLNFDDLYTSGYWSMVFEHWYLNTAADDKLLLEDSRRMLSKATDVSLRREIAQEQIRLFSRYAKDYLLPALGTEYFTIPINGDVAPEIETRDASFIPKNSLIVFYETGCGNCHYELAALKQKYPLLVDNNIRVISIAADLDQNVFGDTSSDFAWNDKLCDLEGFDGVNFRNYGIVGTPTFILTDEKGMIRGRYASMNELFK